MTTRLIAAAIAISGLLTAAAASAQTSVMSTRPDIYQRAKPSGTVSDQPLALSLKDAVARGLQQNLGVLFQEAREGAAQGARWRALSDLLPHVTGNVRQSDQIINLAAFGFTGFPGIPEVIGPFGVFDARVGISAPVVDVSALRSARAASATVSAEKSATLNARELVVLAVANLYFEALADAGRLESANTEVSTAEALAAFARDQQAAGIVAGIDVLRQQVQLQAARQRQIAAENQLAKRKLELSRAIGLPPGQAIELTDKLSDAPSPPVDQKEAVGVALASRPDVKSAEARVSAASLARGAATASYLPSLHIDGDTGVAGSSAANTTGVFTIAANVRIPIFEGGSTRGKVAQADAELKAREADLADLKSGVEYEVAAALLDLRSVNADLDASRTGLDLARRELVQAEDRFRAGVASTLELAEAQQSVALASERYIGSLYRNLIARANLARAMGVVEARLADFLGGSR